MFYAKESPAKFPSPEMVLLNESLAQEIGLSPNALRGSEGAALFSGQQLLPETEPLALAYAGHQYGQFNMLGDGRAHLLGEQIAPSGERLDIQLKGSGQTPYSRGGDGRAALGPMLREYLISEAMHALHIPTTRSLAVTVTGEPVWRQRLSPGAVLTRIARSHLRVGTFEYAAHFGTEEHLRALANYAIERLFPECQNAPNRYEALLQSVVERQACLLAQWMLVGFIHGVMNTDNMAISGETLDYGPCAFMNVFSPDTVYSSIDRYGRYAYGAQPKMAMWNLQRLGDAMAPLLGRSALEAKGRAQNVVSNFEKLFEQRYRVGLTKKLGLIIECDQKYRDCEKFVFELLSWMQKTGRDYTRTFHMITANLSLPAELSNDAEFCTWYDSWRTRIDEQDGGIARAQETMSRVNPIVIPRNHCVEHALTCAVENRDMAPFERLLRALQSPFDAAWEKSSFYEPPTPAQDANYRTYCGT